MTSSERTGDTMTAYQEQREYLRLVDEARALGIPTSLDDPRSPKTVDELRGAVARAKFDADFYA
jgi:hypothetical protein